VAWVLDLQGLIPYDRATRLQLALQQLRIEEAIPDTFLLLEHPSVITLGRRGRKEHLLADENQLAQQGVEVVTASRGGDITWHGPGQLVCYPIVNVSTLEAGSHGFLECLEEVAIQTAGAMGVEAFRVQGKNGAWTNAGKLAAIGFSLKRWVSMHGLSFNLHPDLRHFDLIVGCGLVGDPVCSIASMLGVDHLDMSTARAHMTQALESVFHCSTERYADPESFPAIIKNTWIQAEGGHTI